MNRRMKQIYNNWISAVEWNIRNNKITDKYTLDSVDACKLLLSDSISPREILEKLCSTLRISGDTYTASITELYRGKRVSIIIVLILLTCGLPGLAVLFHACVPLLVPLLSLTVASFISLMYVCGKDRFVENWVRYK